MMYFLSFVFMSDPDVADRTLVCAIVASGGSVGACTGPLVAGVAALARVAGLGGLALSDRGWKSGPA